MENVPTGDPRRVSEGPWVVGEDFKGYGHSSTKRMDIIKTENECALLKYSGISHDFRERPFAAGQDLAAMYIHMTRIYRDGWIRDISDC